MKPYFHVLCLGFLGSVVSLCVSELRRSFLGHLEADLRWRGKPQLGQMSVASALLRTELAFVSHRVFQGGACDSVIIRRGKFDYASCCCTLCMLDIEGVYPLSLCRT